ncbi:MAG: helix-turn-helix domain-containing protein [Pseudomonadota bacterium]
MTHELRAELLSPRDVATLLGVSAATLWRRSKDGTLPEPVKIGGLTRFRRAEIERFIAGDAA